MSASPSIAVITATRNVATILPGLYESLVAQDYANFEWVVADGASSDGTLEVLRRCATTSSWVKFRSEADFGIYDALNKALVSTGADYYVVAGADDRFAAGALSQFAALAARTNADVVLAKVIKGGRIIGGYRPWRAWLGPSRVFRSSHSVGTLIRRELHHTFGHYSRRFPLLADVYFLKVLMRSGSVRFTSAEFIAGTFTEGGATSDNELQLLAENWQIQMLTEPFPPLQILLFIGKLLTRYVPLTTQLTHLRRRQGGASPD